jgi:lysophospholipase L1-like esterase
MRRTFKTFALAGIAALAMAVSTAIPAQAAPRLNASTYVALGDSYSSGASLGGNLVPPPGCDRSSAAYPVVLAGGTNFVSFKACSGATIAYTLALLPTVPQPNVKVVTLTVGFNDTHWAAAVKALLSGDTQGGMNLLSQTTDDITTATGPVAQNIPGLIAGLRTAYPKATIYWGGYVRQFGAAERVGDSCTFAYSTPYGTVDTSISNQLANYLDSIVYSMNFVIQADVLAARSAGAPITYVNADVLFTGHRACNNPTPFVFNLHPTVAGQLLYAQAFKDAGAGSFKAPGRTPASAVARQK